MPSFTFCKSTPFYHFYLSIESPRKLSVFTLFNLDKQKESEIKSNKEKDIAHKTTWDIVALFQKKQLLLSLELQVVGTFPEYIRFVTVTSTLVNFSLDNCNMLY